MHNNLCYRFRVRVNDNDDEYVQDYMLIVCVLNNEGIEMVGEN